MARQPAKSRSKTATTSTATATAVPDTGLAPVKPTRTRKPATKKASPPTSTDQPRIRFTLYNLLGQERAYYLVQRSQLDRDTAPRAKKVIAHHIIIVDRSGSMWGSMDEVKATLEKLLLLDVYANSDLCVSLLSYSSHGDLTVHFERSPILDILKPQSQQMQEIRKLRPTSATCISQALLHAVTLINDDESTAITLHTDGYANDPSPSVDVAGLEKACEQLQQRPAFMNTIAYGWADFRLLSRLAESLSGNCVLARDVQTLFTGLNDTAQRLLGNISPPIELPLPEGVDFQVFVSHSASKFNGAAGLLRIRGLKVEDDAVVYHYRKLTRKEYDAAKDVPVQQTHEAVWAFARAQLAAGNLNLAKCAVASTFDATMIELHGRALTNPQIAALLEDLDGILLEPKILLEYQLLTQVPVNRRLPVVDLMRLLEANRDGFTLNLPEMLKTYQRRGLRRIEGHRDEQGNLIKPWLKAEYLNPQPHVRISSVDLNRTSATLNMLIAQPVQLVRADNGTPIRRVAGIPLDHLQTFNNYTIVGDGYLNVAQLLVKISDRALFDWLVNEGLLERDGRPATREYFDPQRELTLRLDRSPIVPPLANEIKLDGLFERLATLKVLESLLTAHLKEVSAELTPEQVEELKKHYLSKNLYLNFPTTTEYTDLQRAIAEGSVDTRTSYKVELGSREILNTGKLHSANKFLERMYQVTDAAGRKLDKPSFDELLGPGYRYSHKQLSARTKVTKVDEFMKPLFDEFLGLAKPGPVAALLTELGARAAVEVLATRAKTPGLALADHVAALSEAKRLVAAEADRLFAERLSPLVMFIGSTGMLPDEIDTPALSADALGKKYPDLQFSKDEAEGTYFEVGTSIIGVYAKVEYFSR